MRSDTAPNETLLQRLPLPLAQIYRRAHNAKTPLERHLTALSFWEASLKLLASVAIVEFAQRGEADSRLAEKLQNLVRPQLGHWWEFVRLLVPVLADEGDESFRRVRDLLLGRTRDDFPRAAGLDSALRQALGNKKQARVTVRFTELFDRLVQYRNQVVGHGSPGQLEDDFSEHMAQALLAGVAEILGRLDILAARRLVYVAEIRQSFGLWLVQRYELIGESARRIATLELPHSQAARLPNAERVYLEQLVPASGGRPPSGGYQPSNGQTHQQTDAPRSPVPGNIMVTAEGTQAVLMDLGLAQLADEMEGRVTRTREFVGTLRYASPEQILAVGKVDRRTDIYGLGATLWELLTLRPMFGATEQTPTAELMQRIQYEEPARVRKYQPGIARDLDSIVLKCLEKDPKKRYGTARELAQDLQHFLSGKPVRARPVGDAERMWRWCLRNRLVAGLMVVVLSLLSGTVLATMIALRANAYAQGKRDADRMWALEAVKGMRTEFEAELKRAVQQQQRGSERREAQNSWSAWGRKKRFGIPDPATRAYIRSDRADLERLEELVERVLEVNSWQQLLRGYLE